jgi:hypothetical protein
MTMSAGANFELVVLRGGAHSIKSLAHGETMHVGTDPVTEAAELHVSQQRIAERSGSVSPFVVWDVGLGPAANAIAVLEALGTMGGEEGRVELHSFEISTEVLEFALLHAEELGYLVGREALIRELLDAGECHPAPNLLWRLHRGDFSKGVGPVPAASAILFDPYSPSRNPEMWNHGTFSQLREAADPRGCTLTSYTRSTSARVTMLLAGWYVGAGIATGDKEETTMAATSPELLTNPLGPGWLSRVRSSANSVPLRGRIPMRGPISPEDYALLEAHPQFA